MFFSCAFRFPAQIRSVPSRSGVGLRRSNIAAARLHSTNPADGAKNTATAVKNKMAFDPIGVVVGCSLTGIVGLACYNTIDKLSKQLDKLQAEQQPEQISEKESRKQPWTPSGRAAVHRFFAYTAGGVATTTAAYLIALQLPPSGIAKGILAPLGILLLFGTAMDLPTNWPILKHAAYLAHYASLGALFTCMFPLAHTFRCHYMFGVTGAVCAIGMCAPSEKFLRDSVFKTVAVIVLSTAMYVLYRLYRLNRNFGRIKQQIEHRKISGNYSQELEDLAKHPIMNTIKFDYLFIWVFSIYTLFFAQLNHRDPIKSQPTIALAHICLVVMQVVLKPFIPGAWKIEDELEVTKD